MHSVTCDQNWVHRPAMSLFHRPLNGFFLWAYTSLFHRLIDFLPILHLEKRWVRQSMLVRKPLMDPARRGHISAAKVQGKAFIRGYMFLNMVERIHC